MKLFALIAAMGLTLSSLHAEDNTWQRAYEQQRAKEEQHDFDFKRSIENLAGKSNVMSAESHLIQLWITDDRHYRQPEVVAHDLAIMGLLSYPEDEYFKVTIQDGKERTEVLEERKGRSADALAATCGH
jgi:hypothetical protein